MRVIDTDAGPARVVATMDDAGKLWSWLQSQRGYVLGLDCESNAVSPYHPAYRLRTVQIGSVNDGGWVIQAQRPGMPNVIQTCVRAHPTWTGHYDENEIRFLERGCPGSIRLEDNEPHCVDTQVVLAWFDPRTVTHHRDNIDGGIPLNNGLKPTSCRLLGTEILDEADKELYARFRELAPKGCRTAKASKTWGFANIDQDDPIYLRYGALDAIIVARIWDYIYRALVERGQWESAKWDVRLQWHINKMTFRGMPVDGPYARWLDGQLEAVLDHNEALLGQFGVNPTGMGPAVGQAFNRFGITSPKTTGGGGESWDSAVLKEIVARGEIVKDYAARHPQPVPAIAGPPGTSVVHYHTVPEVSQYTMEQALNDAVSLADGILMVRKATKFRAAYVAPMLAALEEDGAVHCSMRAVGAVTSRMTAARPALQQPPKKDKRIRAAYRAYPGWVWVSSDLKQGEPRVMAALSGDRNLKRDLLAGDLYDNLARMTYGASAYNADIAEADSSSPHYIMRQANKFGFLAKGYGCAPPKLAALLGLPEQEGARIYAQWDGAYPDLAAYADRLNRQSAVVLESGWVIPLWDRWYVRADGLHCGSRPSRNGLNAATQGNQRYLLSLAAHKLIDEGWSWALSLFLHDEILGMVPAYMAEEFRHALSRCMTMDFHGMPIECDAKILGETWMPQPSDFDVEEIERGVAEEWEHISLDDPDKERLLWSTA